MVVATSEEHKPLEFLRLSHAEATMSVPIASPDASVEKVREALPGEDFQSIHDVAVITDGRLAGLVPIELLMAAAGSRRLAEIMDIDPPTVTASSTPEQVASKMVQHGESSVAVVGQDRRFEGLIPPGRMVASLLAEHDEDIARLGGYLSRSKRARKAAEENVGRRLWHRLPWLLVGLAGAMLSAVVVAGFEEQLNKEILIAFFVPAVVYMADAVGTQTEAVLIRGLAVGIQTRKVVRRELLTGSIVGLLIGAVFLVFGVVAWGEADVAVAVALALVASCSIATLVAMALPFAFQHFGRDPAFGSGPLATVVQDLLSIIVYLAIATAIL